MKKSNVYLVVPDGLRFSILLFFFKKDSKAEHQPAVCAVQKAELRVKIQRENFYIEFKNI